MEEESTPVSKIGLLVLAIFLITALLTSYVYHGYGSTIRRFGFHRPAVTIYTLSLLSPLLFETVYPWLSRHTSGRVRQIVENLHLTAPYLIVVGLMMLVMRFENIFDMTITAALGWDFTPWVYSIEGNVVERIQTAFRSPFLDVTMEFIYITVYALFYISAFIFFALRGDVEMIKKFTFTWVIIYAVALPFYIFFPVNEVWVTSGQYDCGYDYGEVVGVVTSATGSSRSCTSEEGIVRAISSINQCLPSLHNAFAWSVPMILWRSGWLKTGSIAAVISSLVTFSTIYLGIHWITDIVLGIVLAWVVTWAAVRTDYRILPSLRLTNVKWLPSRYSAESDESE
jgi:membrane-associated phospholipid phosphatase